MRLRCNCSNCGKEIVIDIPKKARKHSMSDYSKGQTCNDCIPKNSAARDGINESVYTEVAYKRFKHSFIRRAK